MKSSFLSLLLSFLFCWQVLGQDDFYRMVGSYPTWYENPDYLASYQKRLDDFISLKKSNPNNYGRYEESIFHQLHTLPWHQYPNIKRSVIKAVESACCSDIVPILMKYDWPNDPELKHVVLNFIKTPDSQGRLRHLELLKNYAWYQDKSLRPLVLESFRVDNQGYAQFNLLANYDWLNDPEVKQIMLDHIHAKHRYAWMAAFQHAKGKAWVKDEKFKRSVLGDFELSSYGYEIRAAQLALLGDYAWYDEPEVKARVLKLLDWDQIAFDTRYQKELILKTVIERLKDYDWPKDPSARQKMLALFELKDIQICAMVLDRLNDHDWFHDLEFKQKVLSLLDLKEDPELISTVLNRLQKYPWYDDPVVKAQMLELLKHQSLDVRSSALERLKDYAWFDDPVVKPIVFEELAKVKSNHFNTIRSLFHLLKTYPWYHNPEDKLAVLGLFDQIRVRPKLDVFDIIDIEDPIGLRNAKRMKDYYITRLLGHFIPYLSDPDVMVHFARYYSKLDQSSRSSLLRQAIGKSLSKIVYPKVERLIIEDMRLLLSKANVYEFPHLLSVFKSKLEHPKVRDILLKLVLGNNKDKSLMAFQLLRSHPEGLKTLAPHSLKLLTEPKYRHLSWGLIEKLDEPFLRSQIGLGDFVAKLKAVKLKHLLPEQGEQLQLKIKQLEFQWNVLQDPLFIGLKAELQDLNHQGKTKLSKELVERYPEFWQGKRPNTISEALTMLYDQYRAYPDIVREIALLDAAHFEQVHGIAPGQMQATLADEYDPRARMERMRLDYDAKKNQAPSQNSMGDLLLELRQEGVLVPDSQYKLANPPIESTGKSSLIECALKKLKLK